ncbi:partitioning defective 3 homolog isoform X1 [Biomphalaria glabrata]|uniref:Partitioning defective 3 homolog isoform X1 n=1 Tax=Biomphalaria glabrata TaxID=6526 RepID=A0A9W3BCM1_BIOGL|nr:partitioning defective 3 homolog isoform X1 [Biomphalaria glabrata]XP_055897166.1 partitioning defective 3 homolog isoform X1 [Biomphalaria glabrata]XP_055897171.1 partitioning defective 3 homolog isoform X1 [Biomphalaria glabrata]XP_055897174.1 partitioning defective 3 homolog isoform X1 [Biomphalaria glabrata]XP_055897177.1 partitioning defective 3 homolog isoform X1 [Biomphalaria glabrata]XP_055897185.1 partitioning defective 3 homolog isoform X1 [Biomphalaria glabrata]
MTFKMPIKVIVCFDNVRVTVPCGEGNFPVKELINKAIHRYKRAVGKGTNHWVEVTSLKTVSGGGILDPDDLLSDVVDDREQLVADFEEHEGMTAQHIGGDGASASSTGTASPDFFTTDVIHEQITNGIPSIFSISNQNKSISNNASTDIVVTSSDLSLGSQLKVRRGSAPDLNIQNVQTSVQASNVPRRESVQDSDEPRSESSDEEKEKQVILYSSLDRKKSGPNHFTRDALRASLSSHLERHHWQEEQKRLQSSNISQVQERIGLLEGHDGHEVKFSNYFDSSTVCLNNDGGPLGIHAIPAFDENGKNMGLLIQSIEQDRPVYNDGRIHSGDIVTEINGISLQDVPFQKAQDIFRAAKDSKEIYLKVVHQKFNSLPSKNVSSGKPGLQPPPVMPKPRSHTPLRPSPLTMPSTMEQNSTNPAPVPRDNGHMPIKSTLPMAHTQGVEQYISKVVDTNAGENKTNVTVEKLTEISKSNKKIPPKVPVRSIQTSLTGLMGDVPLNAITNTKKIGKKMVIHLIKGPAGLGFSVTSRDNQTDGNCPIYIRNILPKGAAVQDGQLRPGDRLLQVNGIEMTGKTQSDAVKILRLIPEGSHVELVISRQEEVDEKFKVPRKMADSVPPSKQETHFVDADHCLGEPDLLPFQPAQSEPDLDTKGGNLERITLHIPLNETGSAGLGVSVKGKTETLESNSRDLGIFVKTVLQGGAAYKDGGLQVNDQLLEVNGVKLEGLSNSSAMEALRLAMIQDGKIPGVISLTVARQTGKSETHQVSPSSSKSDGSGQSRSQSDSEVGTILLSHSPSGTVSHIYDVNQSDFSPASLDRFHRYPDLGNIELNTNSHHTNYTDSNTAVTTKINFDKHFKGTVSDSKIFQFQSNHQRPHSTIGFIHELNQVGDDDSQLINSPDDSDMNSKPPFEREGLGRQSMSEKRKGHLDPRSTEIYKIVKANKENKGFNHLDINLPNESTTKTNSTEKSTPLKLSPGSDSRENVKDQVQTNKKSMSHLQEQNDNSWSNQHFGRGRACNESFRAAVDRSYDLQDPALMDTLEEESLESGGNTLDPSVSSRSSVSSEMTEQDNSSIHRLKLKEKEKKGNLLKGFLRFGKGRKSQEEISHRSRSEERSVTDTSKQRENRIVPNLKPVQTIDFIPISQSPSKPMQHSSKSRYEAEGKGQFRSHSVEPSIRNTSYFTPLHPLASSVPKQKWDFGSSPQEMTDPRYVHPAAISQRPKYADRSPYFVDYGTSSENVQSDSEAFMSRAEYIQQLRTLYQQHHQQRQGVYPREDTDEMYEKQLQEIEHNVVYENFHQDESQKLLKNERSFGQNNQHVSPDVYSLGNTFMYSKNFPRSSNDSMTLHGQHSAYREASDRNNTHYREVSDRHIAHYREISNRHNSITPQPYKSSAYNYPVMAHREVNHGQNYKPQMTYSGPTSQHMFSQSNSSFTEFSSAQV